MVTTNMLIGFFIGLTIAIVEFVVLGGLIKEREHNKPTGVEAKMSKEDRVKVIKVLNFVRWFTMLFLPLAFAYICHIAFDEPLI